jgi:hypothetical protein
VATLVGALTLTTCTAGLHTYELPPPLPQWEFGLAAIPLGLALGRSLTIPSRRRQVGLLGMISLTTLGTSALLMSRGFGSTLIPYSLAIVLVCLAYAWPIRSNGFIATVAPLTLGIYLVHPLVARGVLHILPAPGHYAAFILLTACLSALVTWGLRQTPLKRFV